MKSFSWDAQSWQPRRVLPGGTGGLEALAFSPDNNVLAVGKGTQEGPGLSNSGS